MPRFPHLDTHEFRGWALEPLLWLLPKPPQRHLSAEITNAAEACLLSCDIDVSLSHFSQVPCSVKARLCSEAKLQKSIALAFGLCKIMLQGVGIKLSESIHYHRLEGSWGKQSGCENKNWYEYYLNSINMEKKKDKSLLDNLQAGSGILIVWFKCAIFLQMKISLFLKKSWHDK